MRLCAVAQPGFFSILASHVGTDRFRIRLLRQLASSSHLEAQRLWKALDPRLWLLQGRRLVPPDWNAAAARRFEQDRLLSEQTDKLESELMEHPGAMRQLVKLDPLNAQCYQLGLGLGWAVNGQWAKARACFQETMRHPHRVGSRRYLWAALIRSQCLAFSDSRQARTEMAALLAQLPPAHTYARVTRCLLGQANPAPAEIESDGNYQLALYTALGLKAEADKNPDLAQRYYVQALASQKSDRPDYALAGARFHTLTR